MSKKDIGDLTRLTEEVGGYDKEFAARPWEETWTASKYGVLYLDNQDTPFPKRIAGFAHEDSDPDSDLDVARARLAAQAPDMAAAAAAPRGSVHESKAVNVDAWR